jgi:YVTN family beta-propeller protein
MNRKIRSIASLVLFNILSLSLLVSSTQAQNELTGRKVGPQPDGSILVPTNQLLRPAGYQINLPGRPVDLALSPDEKLLFVKNRKSLDLIRLIDRTVLQSLPYNRSGASFTGLCLSSDGKKAFVTEARDRIHIAIMTNDRILHWEKPILLPQPSIGGNPVPGGLTLNDNEDKIIVTLSRNNSLAVVDLKDTSIVEISVGISPYDVLLVSPQKAYVTNWGGRQPHTGESTYNSSGSQVLVDPKTGIANNGAVSVVDLNANVQKKIVEVGLHPSGMVLSPDRSRLYVACANSDIISVIDTDQDKVIAEISVRMHPDMPFGSAPNALAISPDGQYLYVANGTDNAICIIRTGMSNKILGYIPTGWYPGSVILNKSGKILYVANVKGIGSRNQRTDRAGYNTHDHLGTVSIIPLPDESNLAAMTAEKYLYRYCRVRPHSLNMWFILLKKIAHMIRSLVICHRAMVIPVWYILAAMSHRIIIHWQKLLDYWITITAVEF